MEGYSTLYILENIGIQDGITLMVQGFDGDGQGDILIQQNKYKRMLCMISDWTNVWIETKFRMYGTEFELADVTFCLKDYMGW